MSEFDREECGPGNSYNEVGLVFCYWAWELDFIKLLLYGLGYLLFWTKGVFKIRFKIQGPFVNFDESSRAESTNSSKVLQGLLFPILKR